MDVMNRLLALIEQDGFIEIAQYNALFYSREEHDEKDKNRSLERHRQLMFLFTQDRIAREYEKFMKRFRHAIFESDPVKRASELVIGMDSLVNWMHGCHFISVQVMHASPITGDFKKDYYIATHTMYLLATKGIDKTLEYLMEAIPYEF